MYSSMSEVPSEATPRDRVFPSVTRPISQILRSFNKDQNHCVRTARIAVTSPPRSSCSDSPRSLNSEDDFLNDSPARTNSNHTVSSKGKSRRMSQRYSDVDHPDYVQKIAIARTVIGVTMREWGECKVEETVYGAAVLMPQLARTSAWAKTMTILAIQSWFFLVLNIGLQAYLLKMMCKEELVFDSYAGQMFLCDFGANLNNCPGPGCTGPFGSEIQADRLYDWTSVAVRRFVKQSLVAVFPEKAREIDDNVDPGEYGLESYGCRVACSFIFMVSCMGDLVSTGKLAQLLYKIPTDHEAWILPKEVQFHDDSSDDSGRTNRHMGGVDEVTIKVSGMPRHWKVINFVLVVVPKFILWYFTAEVGLTVLMETSCIADLVTNSVGLTFILNIDELIAATLAAEQVQKFLAATEPFPLYDETTSCVGDMHLLTEHDVLKKFRETQIGIQSWRWGDLLTLLPHRLIYAIIGTFAFMWQYYRKHCIPSEDGWKVSKTVYMPTIPRFDWMNAFMPSVFPMPTSDSPVWEMPSPG